MSTSPRFPIYIGRLRTFAYAIDAAGKCPAREFLEGSCPASEVKRVLHTAKVVAEHGEAAPKEEAFRFETGNLSAIKGRQARVPCFRVGDVWYLTHGFIKKRDDWPPAEFTRAERIRAEHLARKE